MKRGKFEHPRPVKPARKGLGVKVAGLALAGLLVFGCGVGGTLAWLQAQSETVTNTFTSSDISITLEETGTENNKKSFQMVPGQPIAKDPLVTVDANSEDCWLFVKITESTDPDLDEYIAYAVAEGWTLVKGSMLPNSETIDTNTSNEIVIGRMVKKADAERSFKILGEGSYTYTDTTGTYTVTWGDNQVGVKPEVTKTMMEGITDTTDDEGNPVVVKKPTLTFTAYATQLYKTNGQEFTAAEAWELAKGLDPADP